ncbi:CAP domain-containing protein [Blautia marasmi]|uniref:CAP domain-containing protein n=1 Tax=Blautia marasmi TaxID=1917868 RepID=UPI002595766E|nr:CAP domain-containing protein [uncultured Blautia sp.]
MKHKILPGFLALAVVSAMGMAPARVQAASLEDVKQNLQGKGIIVAGNISNLDELKQKLESMGIDCSIPGWLESLCPELPGMGQPGNPDTPDDNQPENPDTPDDNQPENPDTPDDNQPENPDTPDDNQPENPDTPDDNQPENPGTPDGSLPENPDTPDNNQPENPSVPDNDTENADFVRQVVNLVNQERAKAGLSPVTADTSIQAAAQVRAKEIEKSFSHTRPDGSSFSTALTQQGVTYRGSGENIAWGQKTPEQVMNGWMNSEGHRANILNKNFTKIGVGYHQNASGTNYWTQLFTY